MLRSCSLYTTLRARYGRQWTKRYQNAGIEICRMAKHALKAANYRPVEVPQACLADKYKTAINIFEL